MTKDEYMWDDDEFEDDEEEEDREPKGTPITSLEHMKEVTDRELKVALGSWTEERIAEEIKEMVDDNVHNLIRGTIGIEKDWGKVKMVHNEYNSDIYARVKAVGKEAINKFLDEDLDLEKVFAMPAKELKELKRDMVKEMRDSFGWELRKRINARGDFLLNQAVAELGIEDLLAEEGFEVPNDDDRRRY